MAGVKEISEVVKFVCSLANAIGEAAKDGEISLSDAAHIVPLLYKLPSAVEGIAEIADEAKDLSQDEVDELVKMIKDELDLPQEKVESGIEDALSIAVQIYALVIKLKA
jgi:hypothetical protein